MLPDALILIDGDLRVQILNRAARKLLSAHRSLRSVGGRLEGADGATRAQLRSLLRQAADEPTGETECRIRSVQRLDPDVFVSARTVGADARAASGPPGLMLLSLRLDRSSCGLAETLTSNFGLSPAETRVVLRLFAGDTLRETAGSLGVAFSTVRVQLQSVFAKTGVNRQPQLLRFLARLAEARGVSDERAERSGSGYGPGA